jgi:hypothetical protein
MKTQKTYKQPVRNYQEVIFEMIESGKIPINPGTKMTINIKHDEWCDVFKGKGVCNCRPEIEYIVPGKSKTLYK